VSSPGISVSVYAGRKNVYFPYAFFSFILSVCNPHNCILMAGI
jgi:hypothetical protein